LVADYVAKGEVEVGIQQTNVIQPYPGTVYLGPLPADLMEYGRFGAAVMTVSKNKDGAQALITFMADPANAALVRKSAMERRRNNLGYREREAPISGPAGIGGGTRRLLVRSADAAAFDT